MPNDPLAELWLMKRCPHGATEPCDGDECPGGSRVRLNPDTVVFRGFEVKPEHVGKTLLHALVQDVIDALGEE